ncbi:phosphatase PAP2 family protein [Mucilaginibacter sp. RS28]|uniref:Phosphatase PAP2 family protein n=1 Tax=Mucilaginibacter straminoryzae TaxID=2932774 RepID=A0A9X1X5I4_9SPHI|nr:phosphatase PAP2 family protein [Mucilaginibacter straminoryzae]MCJ8209983.1 phosphatase PAP2 family protein [Mucilaginibacter straminoryzae]
MLQHLLELDRHGFYLINHEMSNAFFDWLMPILRNARFWIPLYIFIIIFTTWKYKKQGVVVILLLAITVGVADFTSATLIKKTVRRIRPCNDVALKDSVTDRVGCGTGYSFPSTHATDHFSIALFLSLVFHKRWRRVWFWTILWAASISFAQVYVGVHYPVDVICGAVYGSLIGFIFATINKKFNTAFYTT